MRHATLFDVFQDAAGAAGRVFDIVSQEKKYTQDIDLFNASTDLANRQREIRRARKLIYDDSGVNYQNDPGYPKDFQDYIAKQQTQWEAQWGSKHPGRYFTGNLARIKAGGDAALKEQLLTAEAEYAVQRINSVFANERNVIRNNPFWSPDEKLKLELELAERTRGAAGWDMKTYEQARQEALGWSLEEKLKYTAGAGVAADDIRRRYDALMEDGLKGGGAEAGEEAGLYAGLSGAKKAIETARDAAVKAQQAYNFNVLNSLNSEYESARANYKTAVESGDAAKVDAAYRVMTGAYGAGKPLRDAALGGRSGEYNPDNLPRIIGMFEDPPGLPKAKAAAVPAEPARRTKLTNEIESLARRVLDQYRGALLDSERKPQTLTMSEAYLYLDEMVKALNLDIPASEYRAAFDNEFTKIVRTETGSNEAARFVSALLQDPLLADTEEAQKMTGYRSRTNDQRPLDPRQKGAVTALNDEYFNQALNVIAAVGLLPGNRGELTQTIASLRQAYTGTLTKILFDTSAAQGSESTATDTGNNNALAQWLQAAENTPAAYIPSRVEGGSSVSSTMNDTAAARKQQADAYMRTALEGKGIQVIDTNRDGRYISATDSEGNIYRIRSAKRMAPGAAGRTRMQERDVIFIERRNKGGKTGTDSEWTEIYSSAELSGTQKAFSRAADIFTSPPPTAIPNRDYLPTVRPPGWRWSRQ